MQPEAEDNESQAIPPSCSVWCVGHDTDAPDTADDHVHEATPALVPRIALERNTDEAGTIQHHPAAVELSLARYQYRTGDDTWLYIGDGSRSHGLDITLESARRLTRALARYVEDVG
jgi:hypothetical protein